MIVRNHSMNTTTPLYFEILPSKYNAQFYWYILQIALSLILKGRGSKIFSGASPEPVFPSSFPSLSGARVYWISERVHTYEYNLVSMLCIAMFPTDYGTLNIAGGGALEGSQEEYYPFCQSMLAPHWDLTIFFIGVTWAVLVPCKWYQSLFGEVMSENTWCTPDCWEFQSFRGALYTCPPSATC